MNIKSLQTQKKERVSRFYNDKQISYILGLDRRWKEFADMRLTKGENVAFSHLLDYEPLQYLIEKKINQYEAAWKAKRIYREDFTSIFYEEVWHVVVKYSWHDDLYLYEQINLSLDSRAIDLTRACSTDKRKVNHFDCYFNNNLWFLHDPFQLEDETTLKISIEQVCKEDSQLIFALMDSPNLSLRDLSVMFGISHQTAKRKLDKAKVKIRRYIMED